MITFTFAGDESGDVSFAFEKGASRYFVVAAIGTPDPEGLRRSLEELRERLQLAPTYEFGFNAMASSHKLRQKVFSGIAQFDFEAWAVVVDKTTLPDAYRIMRRLDFYLYFVTELIQLIPDKKREGATLILDEFGAAAKLPTELRRFMKAREIPRRFGRVLARRSKGEPLIQIADLLAGAILRRDSHGEPEAYGAIEWQIEAIAGVQLLNATHPASPIRQHVQTGAGRHSRRLFAGWEKPFGFWLCLFYAEGAFPSTLGRLSGAPLSFHGRQLPEKRDRRGKHAGLRRQG